MVKDKLIEGFFSTLKPIAKSFVRYLHISNWLDQKIASFSSNQAVHTFSSVADFWQSIVDEKLSAGDRIKFKEGFITEWFPLSPGALWVGKNKVENFDSLRKGQISAFIGILKPEDAYLGVFRLPLGNNETTFAALSLTSIDSWFCDLGIPLLVSTPVYNNFVVRRKNRKAVEADLEATLRFGQVPLVKSEFIASIGSTINTDYIKNNIVPLDIPSVYLEILSPLDITFRTHNSHPPGYIWTINRQVRNKQMTYFLQDSDIPKEAENGRIVKNVDPYAFYSIMKIAADLSDREAVNACVNAFKAGGIAGFDNSGKPIPRSDNMDNRGIVSLEILTEFDARRPHFRTAIPLEKNPWDDKEALPNITKIMNDLSELNEKRHEQ